MEQCPEEIRRLIDSVQLNNRQAAERDIKNAFNSSRSNFILKVGDFYYHDGIKKKLLYLDGTIDIEYHGLRYNTPVELWIQETHPYSAPICYVKPTPDMHISLTCPHVESDGRIVHPYLQNWISPVSSSTMLISQLSQAFSNSSPLYTNRSSLQQSSMSTPVFHINHNRCRICLGKNIDCVLLECGHAVSCSTCAIRFTTCPFCQKPVVRIKSIFWT